MKVEPVGVCDLCKGPIPPGDWYTRRGPRRFCSVDCRNTANSRAGATLRGQKAKKRVAEGRWLNPAKLNPPTGEEQARSASLGRRREVAEGRWRNPALSEGARVKLSRPRKHEGDLHRAIEKLKQGRSVADLTPEEAEAHRAYRRRQRAELWARTPEDRREHWREVWRLAKRRRPPSE
jgi:hypothetical protein